MQWCVWIITGNALLHVLLIAVPQLPIRTPPFFMPEQFTITLQASFSWCPFKSKKLRESKIYLNSFYLHRFIRFWRLFSIKLIPGLGSISGTIAFDFGSKFSDSNRKVASRKSRLFFRHGWGAHFSPVLDICSKSHFQQKNRPKTELYYFNLYLICSNFILHKFS